MTIQFRGASRRVDLGDARRVVADEVVDLKAEVARLDAALERPFEVAVIGTIYKAQVWRVVQRCLVCEIELALTFDLPPDATTVSAAWLHRQLFELYDLHRCDAPSTAELQALYERTERESIRIARRAAALELSERAASPGAIGLFARAEREFVLLAELAASLDRRLRGIKP
ncbi:MAG: hypothetical protein H0T79_12045 [Deltaproteobacteria bacterium]|nr:hypothetical protein [Deltaproteobacteria bacterium]